MATYTFVPFNLPEASDFADLVGIRHDLESACNLAKELKCYLEHIFKQELNNMQNIDAFSTAILVRYIRPFSNGANRRLGESVLGKLNKYQRAKHDYLKAFRDKHIAHSVNAFEEFQSVARYVEERVDVEGVYAIECQHSRVVGLSVEDVEDIIELATIMLCHLEHLLEIEKQKLLTKVRSIPLEELLSAEEFRHASSDKADIKKPRRKQGR